MTIITNGDDAEAELRNITPDLAQESVFCKSTTRARMDPSPTNCMAAKLN